MTMTRHSIIRAFLLLSIASLCASRPSNPRESIEQGTVARLFLGILNGVQGVYEFLGFDDYTDVEELEKAYRDQGYEPTMLQLVGLGLARTGTTSLVVALERLGYTVVHDDEQLKSHDLFHAEQEEETTWDELQDALAKRGFNATFKVDYEWAARRPQTKTILTVRDNADVYVDSWLNAVKWIDYMRQPPFCWMKNAQETVPSMLEEYLVETTGNQPHLYLDRPTLRKTYLDYIEDVKEAIPTERLLVFNVKQGWEPLCSFLEKPIPDEPFPHVHDRMKLIGEMYVYKVVTWI